MIHPRTQRRPCKVGPDTLPRLLRVCGIALAAAATIGCAVIDDRPAAWEYLSPAIFQPNCATSSCHSRAAAVAGLDFSDPERGYTSLTALWVWIEDPRGTVDQGCRPLNGSVFCQRPHRPMVTPFNPAQSRLVNMLRARAAPRMPTDRPLPEADIQLVERWILNGATRTVGGDPSREDADADAGADRPGDAAADSVPDTLALDQGSRS